MRRVRLVALLVCVQLFACPPFFAGLERRRKIVGAKRNDDQLRMPRWIAIRRTVIEESERIGFGQRVGFKTSVVADDAAARDGV